MRRQSGMAVIMALLIVALATTAASLVLWQQGLWWHQLENDKSRAQLRLVAEAGLGWAMEILRFNNVSGNGVVALSQLWAQPLPQTEAQGVKVSGALTDLQGRFNINSLVNDGGQVDKDQLMFYRDLLKTLSLPSTLSEPLLRKLRGLSDSEDPLAQPDQGAAPRPSHPLARVEMLRWLPGYTPEVMDKLSPHIAALPPTATTINVNTATDKVLKTLMPGIGDGNLMVMMKQRQTVYYRDKADFLARPPGNMVKSNFGNMVGVASNYFLLDSRSSYGKAKLRMRAMIYSNLNVVRLVWRQDGNDDRALAARSGGEINDDAATLSAGRLAR
jgi:general secretion pathway protein K